MTMSSEQLERQSEQSRAEVEMTLQELRARLTPGQIVDEILCYAKDGGGQFLSNLGRQATNNPLPVTLIGAGLAWFLFGNKTGSSNGVKRYNQNWDYDTESDHMSGNGSHIAQKAGETYESAKRGLGDMAESATRGLGNMAESAKRGLGDMAHSAGSAISGIGEAASGAYETAAGKASRAASSVKATAMDLERKTVHAAKGAADMMMKEPLVLIGVGLAVGALIGALVPNTEAENRLMGDAADQIKSQATDLASEQLEKAKDTAESFLNEASGNGANPNANLQG